MKKKREYPEYMKKLWPELRRFESFEAAYKGILRASHRSGLSLAFILGLVGIVVCLDIGGDSIIRMVEAIAAALGLGYGTQAAIMCALALAYSVGLYCLFHKRMRRKLREELVRSGVTTCLYCGYDLRSVSEPRCPECGKPMQS